MNKHSHQRDSGWIAIPVAAAFLALVMGGAGFWMYQRHRMMEQMLQMERQRAMQALQQAEQAVREAEMQQAEAERLAAEERAKQQAGAAKQGEQHQPPLEEWPEETPAEAPDP